MKTDVVGSVKNHNCWAYRKVENQMLVKIEEAPTKVCFESDGFMYCNWVQRGEFAVMADDGGYLRFKVKKKDKVPPEEEETLV